MVHMRLWAKKVRSRCRFPSSFVPCLEHVRLFSLQHTFNTSFFPCVALSARGLQPFKNFCFAFVSLDTGFLLALILGLDLQGDVFAQAQVYAALSRAQNKRSAMCLISPSHALSGIPHAANVVYDPFMEATTGIVRQIPPLPHLRPLRGYHRPPSPPTPSWTICRDAGNPSCRFRALARGLLGDSNLHSQVRREIVH